MRIAISPDENPGQSGSVAADGTTERSVNLLVAQALQQALFASGQDAWFDPGLTWVERVAKAEADGTRLLVACAHNDSTPGRSGTQFVFCQGGPVFGRQGEAARNVYAQLAMLKGWPPRIADAIEDIYECCEFPYDTLYVELLFMSPDDQPLWSLPGYPVAAAEAIARGLALTYGFQYGAGTPPPDPAWATADWYGASG